MSGELVPRLGASLLSTVPLAPGVRWTSTGLEIDHAVTGETWADLVLRLLDLRDRLKWPIGDALAWGELHRPEAFGQIFDPETLGDRYAQISGWIRVASRIPPTDRRPSLSWSAHRAVSHLPDPERDAWLDRAEAEGWRSNRLESEVRGGQRRGDALVEELPRHVRIEQAARAVWRASSLNLTREHYVTEVEPMQALGRLLDGEKP